MKHLVVPYFIIIIHTIHFDAYECGIAATKCKEYGKAVYVQKDSPVLMMNARKDTESECGIVSVPLVVGGTKSALKEFPHMAVLGFGLKKDGNLQWDCGGALISDLYILTAAHCVLSREYGPVQAARLGIVDLEDDSFLQEKSIVKRIVHPKYERTTKINDIALMKMDSPVDFTAYVRPACLNAEVVAPGRKALATGFGKLSYDAEKGSRYLMKVTLNIYDEKPCDAVVKRESQRFHKESMICAGKLEGGKDTCQGDSGGPLQNILTDPYCMYNIVGITSYGKFCGFANTPAVYTKVSDFIPWIEGIVWQ